jgi:hypothetical protein
MARARVVPTYSRCRSGYLPRGSDGQTCGPCATFPRLTARQACPLLRSIPFTSWPVLGNAPADGTVNTYFGVPTRCRWLQLLPHAFLESCPRKDELYIAEETMQIVHFTVKKKGSAQGHHCTRRHLVVSMTQT